MFIVGFANFAGLTVLGVPYAVPLGLLAGILEAVPNLGPIYAAVPAVLVGFGVAPITGVAVIALAFLIQQLEAYLFVPKVMQKSAGVNPIVSLLSLIIGFKIAGVIGAVLSIPVVLTMVVLFEELYAHPKEN
jgi:predicted PurR-regulated permease PerM